MRRIKHFTSWLGLCPGTKITGGKLLSGKTKHCANRAAQALRLAAAALRSSKSALGAYFRRLCSRMDKPKAVTAAAHKLARLIFTMLTRGEEYTDQGQDYYEERYRERVLRALSQRAAKLGMQVVPCSCATTGRRRGDLSGSLINGSIERLSLISRAGMSDVPLEHGTFAAPFPVFGGRNDFILLGGPHEASRLSYMRTGGIVRTFSSNLPRAELFVMTTWNDEADLDLYVHAPISNADDVAWFSNPRAANGLVLDIDAQQRGSEVVTLSVQDTQNPGRVDAGAYRVRAHYYRGTGPVSGEALIAINENKGPGRALCRVRFALQSANQSNTQLDGTGPDWVDIATVDVSTGKIQAVAPLVCKDTTAPFVQSAIHRWP